MNKNRRIFWKVFGIVFFFGLVFFGVSYAEFRQDVFRDQVEDHFQDVLSGRVDGLESYFSSLEGDIGYLIDFNGTRTILTSPRVQDSRGVVFDVKQKTMEFAKDIENYLEVNSDLTSEELLSSEEFRGIVSRPVGANGYPVFGSMTFGKLYLHEDASFSGVDLADIYEVNPELGEEQASAFYPWMDSDGVVRDKYAEFVLINHTTTDGEVFFFGATSYLEDYEVVEVDEELRVSLENFVEDHGYHNILFIAPDKRIVYMAYPMEGFGIDIDDAREGLKSVYEKVISEDGVSFYGPLLGHLGTDEFHVSAGSKVYDGDEYLGVLVVIDNMQDVWDILDDEAGEEDVYLVNDDSLLVSPISEKRVSVFLQKISSDVLDSCLGEIKNGVGGLDDRELYSSSNFRGEATWGVYFPVAEFGWCLFVEDDFDALAEKFDAGEFFGSEFWTWMGVFIVFLLVGFIIDRSIVSKGRAEILSEKISEFFRKIKFSYFLFLVFLFLVFYSVFLGVFFPGIWSWAFVDSASDLLTALLASAFVYFAVNSCSKGACKFMFPGGVLIFVERLLEVPMQEYQKMTGFSIGSLLWAFVLFIGFLGYLLLLLGFRRLKENV